MPQKHIRCPKRKIDQIEIEHVKDFNFLGIVIDEQLNWKSHVEYISCKITRTNGIINKLKHYLPLHIKLSLYNSLILSHINYGILACGHESNRILKLQKKAVRIISASKYNSHTEPLFKELKKKK